MTVRNPHIFLKQMDEVIEENLHDSDFKVSQLAKKLQLNRMTLYRRVKEITRQKPNELILNKRLAKASELLKNSNQKVSEISEKCGFANANYFSKKFKQKYHYTPTKFGKLNH